MQIDHSSMQSALTVSKSATVSSINSYGTESSFIVEIT